jgi:C1A family cysteine protease
MTASKVAPKTRHGGLGYKPEDIDIRDHAYRPEVAYADLPARVDWRDKCSPVRDQGQLGSCTGCSIAACMDFIKLMQGEPLDGGSSALFVYYGERVIEKSVNTDAGAEIRDGMAVAANTGICTEALYPYVISQFRKKPSVAAYKDASNHQLLEYQRIQTYSLSAMKACLAAGFPYVFGFRVYQSFESDVVASTGIVPMPAYRETYLGGHAVLAVGYDIDKSIIYVQNSWGTSWGQDGFFEMPMKYFTQNRLVSDIWTMRKAE